MEFAQKIIVTGVIIAIFSVVSGLATVAIEEKHPNKAKRLATVNWFLFFGGVFGVVTGLLMHVWSS